MNSSLCLLGRLRACIVLVAACATVSSLSGQDVPRENRENIELAGTLKQMGAGALQIATQSGEQWLVRLEGRPQELRLAYSAKADPSFLKSGMLVQFEGTVNKRGQLQEKLDLVVVTSPREGIEIGLYPEGNKTKGSEFFTDDKPEDKPKEKPKKQPKVEAVPCRITGYITKISRTGELTVNCRNAAVTAGLAENAKVSVDLTDLSLAQPGDKVEVRGWYIKNQKGTAWSREVSVSAANVLGEAKKKPRGTEKSDEKKPSADKPADATEKPAETKAKSDAKEKSDK